MNSRESRLFSSESWKNELLARLIDLNVLLRCSSEAWSNLRAFFKSLSRWTILSCMVGVIHAALLVNSGTWSTATFKNVLLKNWIASSWSCLIHSMVLFLDRSSSIYGTWWSFRCFWIDLFWYFLTMHPGRWSEIPILSTLVNTLEYVQVGQWCTHDYSRFC